MKINEKLLKIQHTINSNISTEQKIKEINLTLKNDKELMFFLKSIFNDHNYQEKNQISDKKEIKYISRTIRKYFKDNKINEFSFETIRNNFEKIIIPNYQRFYDWDSNTFELFLKSISGIQNNKNLGSMIVLPENENRDISVKGDLILIDGQQRMVSIYGFLIAVSYIHVFINAKSNDNEQSLLNIESFLRKDLRIELQAHNEESENKNNIIPILNKAFRSIQKKYNNEDIATSDQENIEVFLKRTFFVNILKKKNINYIEKILFKLDCIDFTLNICNSEQEAYKKFYEANAISKPLKKVDILRSLFYRLEFDDAVSWGKARESFEKIFDKDSVIQDFYFYWKGTLAASPAAAFNKLEADMTSLKNKSEKNNFLKSIISYKETIFTYPSKISKYHDSGKISLYLYMIYKYGHMNKNVLNLIRNVSLAREGTISDDENIEKYIYNNLVSSFLYKNDIVTPKNKSNIFDNDVKNNTKDDKAVNASTDVIEDFETLKSKYPVSKQKLQTHLKIATKNSSSKNVWNLKREFESKIGKKSDREISYLINHFIEEEITIINPTIEHFIPQTDFENKTAVSVKFNKISEINFMKGKESFINLFFITKELNGKLGNLSILEKIPLIIEHKSHVSNFELYEEMFNEMFVVIGMELTNEEKESELIEILISKRKELYENAFKN